MRSCLSALEGGGIRTDPWSLSALRSDSWVRDFAFLPLPEKRTADDFKGEKKGQRIKGQEELNEEGGGMSVRGDKGRAEMGRITDDFIIYVDSSL